MDASDLFEILVREHADMLMVYLRAVVRDDAVADDLFQETMLTAWRKIDQYDRTRPFGPWLRGIAGRLVLAHRRQEATGLRPCAAATLEFLDHRLTQFQRLAGDTFDEKLDALRACVDALPASFRQALQLRYQESVRPAELPTRLHLTAAAVKKRLQRARHQLLRCIQTKLAATGVTR
ncbi:MAG: sigma-70 family RNA polymerase sigma factor [Pirellulales bacterium]